MFRFQQFSVRDQRSCWKVGIDSILLGAWTSAGNAEKILDAGAGSGILSLIMAQRVQRALVTAVEIDSSSCLDLKENFVISPWCDRLTLVQQDIGDYYRASDERFDLIIANPPFFTNAGQAGDRRSLARSGHQFNAFDLPGIARVLLSPNGSLAVVCPFGTAPELIGRCNQCGLYVNRRTDVKHQQSKPFSLTLLQMSSQLVRPAMDVLTLYKNNIPTQQFDLLTADLYLR